MARIERALRDYAAERVTAWRAAQDAGVSLYEMLDRIHGRGIPYELDPEQLDLIRADRATPARRVAERQPAYRTDEEAGIDELRARFKPERVEMLFVGESSPAQGTHFYRANSNLFRAMHAAYVSARGQDAVPSGEAFLKYFREQGAWLVDLAQAPVNKVAGRNRRAAVEAGVPRLAEIIRNEQPLHIVVVKRDMADAVRRAAAAADSTASLFVLPFPVRQWAPIFRSELAALLS